LGQPRSPGPERLYFWFGEPIGTVRFGGRYDDTAAARALRDEVKQAILVGIQFLRDERDQDPNRGLSAPLWRRSAYRIACLREEAPSRPSPEATSGNRRSLVSVRDPHHANRVMTAHPPASERL
jgi:hypothetical protein